MNDWANNREAKDLRRHRADYDVKVMVGMNSASRGAICGPVELTARLSNGTGKLHI